MKTPTDAKLARAPCASAFQVFQSPFVLHLEHVPTPEHVECGTRRSMVECAGVDAEE